MVCRSAWSAVLKEIDKCDVVCANCHRIRAHAGKFFEYSDSKRKRREFLDSLKKNPCTDCGRSFEPFQMDFDHLRDKSRSYPGMTGFSIARVKLEVTKCELVCADCHRFRTMARIKKAA